MMALTIGGYEVVKELGQGGMAEVFLGREVNAKGKGKLVAIKRLYPHLARRSESLKMFFHEAKVMSQLNHPNIVQVLDFGKEEDTYYMLLEYVDGFTLKSLLTRASAMGVRIPLSMGAFVVKQLLEGLHALHTAKDESGKPMGLIHRDLSPDNILISRSGRVKLSDFGIAKSELQTDQTKAGVLKGKMSYQSPEQLMELPYDCRADLFCAGALLFEATTMLKAFTSRDFASAIIAICQLPSPVPSAFVKGYPMALENIVTRALAKAPTERYQDARDMVDDLALFLERENAFDRKSLAASLTSLEVHLAHRNRTSPGSSEGLPAVPDGALYPPLQGLVASTSPPPRQLWYALGFLLFSFVSGFGVLLWAKLG